MQDSITDYWTAQEGKVPKRYIVPVDDEGVLTFPDELMNALDWHEGDVLEWIDNNDGSFSLKKQN